jgi:hypothetical protein
LHGIDEDFWHGGESLHGSTDPEHPGSGRSTLRIAAGPSIKNLYSAHSSRKTWAGGGAYHQIMARELFPAPLQRQA